MLDAREKLTQAQRQALDTAKAAGGVHSVKVDDGTVTPIRRRVPWVFVSICTSMTERARGSLAVSSPLNELHRRGSRCLVSAKHRNT